MRPKGPSKERFEAIFAEGRRVSGPLAKVVALPGSGLVGVATAKKIGSRPRRNREKRRFREAIVTQPEIADSRFDYVIIVGKSAADSPFARIQEEVRELFSRAAERWENELESS